MLAAVVLIVAYVPPTPVFRWILKPVSSPELSVQERLTLFVRRDVIVRPDGAAGMLYKVVTLFSPE